MLNAKLPTPDNIHIKHKRWTHTSSTYRITAIVKVETYIITSIAMSLMEWVVILVIMYVKTFKTDDMVFIGNIICLTSH
jgi:hypothetical protein